MGCCGSVVIDREISHAVNMGELITIMERKKSNLSKEIAQINEHLKDKRKKVTVARVDDLTDDELKSRVPYLEKLVTCYDEVISIMKSNKNVINLYNKYLVTFSGNKRTSI